MENSSRRSHVLAFDTANEVISVGVGALDANARSVTPLACEKLQAHRASNTQLLPVVDSLLEKLGIGPDDLACVCVGRGPGSFTGVRIAMATAKGIACAASTSLVGVSTQESVAWGAWLDGERGRLLVASDAMRKEIYPSYFMLSDRGVERLTPDVVVKADAFASGATFDPSLKIAGDAALKYKEMLSGMGEVLPEPYWTPSGRGLLATLEAAWRNGEADSFDAFGHDPVAALPIYTRLSDAEENERARLASPGSRNLLTGVQGESAIDVMPFDICYAEEAAAIEAAVMGTDAWSADMFADELPRKDRTWWMALADGRLVGYAGMMIAGDEAELLKIAVLPEHRRHGVAATLLSKVAYDAENLAASSALLEVRAGNDAAKAFYEAVGFKEVGSRRRYYSDGEDAVLMRAQLADVSRRCAALAASAESGMTADHCGQREQDAKLADIKHPLILAIESSCDETACAIVDGDGAVLSNVVASQIDFHARFGGVVPEIASRKHVEAIVGVTRVALEEAAAALGLPILGWSDMDAVAVTYAPGLVGALVVGVAFAKGAAWAAGKPLVAVNHLEGHLYANKLASDFAPPAVVSLVSGGNTMLVHMRDWQDYEILGATIDDAVGEAFDKVAKALGFPYPGGPIISKQAESGDASAIDFPRALMHSGDYRFSLSGLKTAVVTYIEQARNSEEGLNVPDVCASFQQAVIDVQVAKAKRALEETCAPTFCLGGGVAANPALRSAYEEMCASIGVKVVMPPLSACGDNAAMIALVGLDRYRQARFADLSQDAFAHADLSVPY